MKTILLKVGIILENTYIYYDEKTGEAAVIDPGAEADLILKTLAENNLILKSILLTHGHFDHIGAVAELRTETNAAVYASKEERELLNNKDLNLSLRFELEGLETDADIYLEDGESVKVGGASLKMILTPGHTSGSCCYYDSENKILFSGDTLFCQSIGRTDLPTSTPDTIVPAIENKLYTLDKETVVYPGHNRETTIGNESKYNPYTNI